MVKKPSFGPNFDSFGPNLSPNFFRVFYLHYMLYIATSYHHMQFQGKLMNQTWENGKKLSFGPKLWPPIRSKIWLRQSLHIMVSYHHVQYQKKIMIRSWENLSDGWTDEQTDESDFIGRCPTNVERAI